MTDLGNDDMSKERARIAYEEWKRKYDHITAEYMKKVGVTDIKDTPFCRYSTTEDEE